MFPLRGARVRTRPHVCVCGWLLVAPRPAQARVHRSPHAPSLVRQACRGQVSQALPVHARPLSTPPLSWVPSAHCPRVSPCHAGERAFFLRNQPGLCVLASPSRCALPGEAGGAPGPHAPLLLLAGEGPPAQPPGPRPADPPAPGQPAQLQPLRVRAPRVRPGPGGPPPQPRLSPWGGCSASATLPWDGRGAVCGFLTLSSNVPCKFEATCRILSVRVPYVQGGV